MPATPTPRLRAARPSAARTWVRCSVGGWRQGVDDWAALVDPATVDQRPAQACHPQRLSHTAMAPPWRCHADWTSDMGSLCNAMPFMAGCSLWAACRPLLDAKNPATNLSAAFGTCERSTVSERYQACCHRVPAIGLKSPLPAASLIQDAVFTQHHPAAWHRRLRHGGHGGLGVRGPWHEQDEG